MGVTEQQLSILARIFSGNYMLGSFSCSKSLYVSHPVILDSSMLEQSKPLTGRFVDASLTYQHNSCRPLSVVVHFDSD